MKRQIINTPATQAMYDHLHFAQATRAGDTIWVSGQTGIDPATMMLPTMLKPSPPRLRRCQGRLEAAGATMDDIVELTTFHTDLRGDMKSFATVKDEYLPDRYPSWTAVGVTRRPPPAPRRDPCRRRRRQRPPQPRRRLT